MKQVGICIFVALLAFFLFVAPANAESVVADKPSKESLLAAWEVAQKENPYTVTFEKTAEKDTYNFETSIFPFKGKLKVLNELIEKEPAYYYGDFKKYDKPIPDGDYIGLVEVELPGTEKEFIEKYRYSYSTWDQGNALYYHADTKKWYTVAQWTAYQKSSNRPPESNDEQVNTGQLPESETMFSRVVDKISPWLPLIFILIFVRFFSMRLAKNQKKIQDEYFAKQAETNSILKDILQALRNKPL